MIRVRKSIQPSVDTAAYASGDGIGGIIRAPIAPRTKGSSAAGYVISAGAFDDSNKGVDIDVVVFNGLPSSTSFTDNAPFNPTAADGALIAGVAHIDDWSTFNAAQFGQAEQAGFSFALGKDDDLYIALVARGAITFSATDDLIVSITVDIDG